MTGPPVRRKRPATAIRPSGARGTRFILQHESKPLNTPLAYRLQAPWPSQQVGGVAVERVLPRLAVDDDLGVVVGRDSKVAAA